MPKKKLNINQYPLGGAESNVDIGTKRAKLDRHVATVYHLVGCLRVIDGEFDLGSQAHGESG